VNVNKLFPRLTLSVKLAVAFVVIAAVPLTVVATMATGGAVRQLRERARTTLEFDLELAALGVTRSLRESEQHLTFLVDAFGRSLLVGDTTAGDRSSAAALVSTFLSSDSSAILRARVVDAAGDVLLDVGPLAPSTPGPDAGGGTDLYLALADEFGPNEVQRFMPVELLDPDRGTEGGLVLLPAVAVLRAVRDDDGFLLGIAVVEASAAALFSGLEVNSPELPGVTGLVDEQGFLLYHTRWKSDWKSLLGRRQGSSLEAEFGTELASGMRSGVPGTIRGPGHTLVSYRSIDLGPPAPRLTLYRTIPLGAIDASAWDFLRLTTFIGFAILVVVLGASVVAARQLSKPIYRLRTAARRLAAGGSPAPVDVHTNDELEDLAADFGTMARTLDNQRSRLEALVEDRTRDLSSTRAQLSEVVANATDAIIGLDDEECVTLWNQGAASLFGYSEQEALSKGIDELIGMNDPELEHEKQYIRQAVREDGGVGGLRTRRRNRAGEMIPVSLTQSRILNDDRVVGSSLVIRDYRLQSRLEEQMRRSERVAAVSIMAAGLAHEINNPLAILRNRIELMQREISHEDRLERFRKDLNVLGQHVERIRGLTSDLLSFAREDGDEPSPVALDDVVGRTVRLLDKVFRTKGVDLETIFADHLPPVHGSEKALETVFVNLLLNAGQATPPGGRVAVEVRNGERNGMILGEVRDTGPGVPPELRSRIFEPFFTTKADNEGTGLGLVVCRTIVERHGGRIRLAEAPGGGSRFIVELPASPISHDTSQAV
jgi:PAS domain S-box-containing protein